MVLVLFGVFTFEVLSRILPIFHPIHQALKAISHIKRWFSSGLRIEAAKWKLFGVVMEMDIVVQASESLVCVCSKLDSAVRVPDSRVLTQYSAKPS